MKIAHISDIHCGEVHFVPGLMERAINEINDQQPDIVVCSGDLTAMGFKHEYVQAKAYLDRLECDCVVVIPGNHDSRNVGYIHFGDLFGSRNHVVRREGVTIVAVDSTEPDLDHGQIGRGRYPWIEQQFAEGGAELRIFVLHHHLLPIPGTGRERNIVYDAGDAIECLQRAGVDIVLSGHKHVPYAWRLEDLFLINAGYGVPAYDDPDAALLALEPELVLDLSDEPVLGPAARLRLASRVLAAGIPYAGADFRIEPPQMTPFPLPSLSVFATGKRVGKTAVSAHIARLLARDRDVVAVAMGRGGPQAPEVMESPPGVEELLALARDGRHAASDYLEIAATAGVVTVGCRRCGGGL